VTSLLSDMQTVPLSAIKPHPENPRRGNVAAIAASLDLNKQYRPLVVQRSTGFILAGNHTWRGAESLGWPTVEVVYVDVSDDRARRIMAADNRTADLGTYDDEALVLLLQSLEGDLAGTGYDGEALAELVAGLYADVILRRYEEHAGVGAVLRTEGLYSPDADPDLS
jgi:ParB-like chromosome segregation protein Spo0J